MLLQLTVGRDRTGTTSSQPTPRPASYNVHQKNLKSWSIFTDFLLLWYRCFGSVLIFFTVGTTTTSLAFCRRVHC